MRRTEKLYSIVTPIWTKEMGRRLALARMKWGLNQRELATLLSTTETRISQQTLAELERGNLRYGHFTLARMIAVMGMARVEFALFNTNAEAYSSPKITTEYWRRRLGKKPGQKRRGNPRWAIVDRLVAESGYKSSVKKGG